MGVLCTSAENSGLKKRRRRKRTAVKLKASDYVGLPKKKESTAVKLKASDYVGLPNEREKIVIFHERIA